MAGSLGTPLLATVISPVKAAALLLPIFIVSDWFGLYAYRREFDKRNLMILIPAGVAGIASAGCRLPWCPTGWSACSSASSASRSA